MAEVGSWFDKARLGLFVHWDHASQQGLELSWPLVGGISVLPQCQAVSVEQYHSSAATFDPKAWDPKALAGSARRSIALRCQIARRFCCGPRCQTASTWATLSR